MRLHDLEQSLSQQMGLPLVVVRANEEVHPDRLNQEECDRLRGCRFAKRRRDWLLGRNALKEILLTLGEKDDTTGITCAGGRISLTHAGHTAYAAGAQDTDCCIGIDYEPLRIIDTRVARWFLTDEESEWLRVLPESARSPELVRLWTVKEAAYKSHPDNDNGRMSLCDFSINDPSAHEGAVAAGRRHIEIASRVCRTGYLSVAICGEEPEPIPESRKATARIAGTAVQNYRSGQFQTVSPLRPV